jgi:hypothetical protein
LFLIAKIENIFGICKHLEKKTEKNGEKQSFHRQKHTEEGDTNILFIRCFYVKKYNNLVVSKKNCTFARQY